MNLQYNPDQPNQSWPRSSWWKTPINHIIGYCEMLQEEAKELGYRKVTSDLKKISGAARHWLALMDEYLVTPANSGTEPPAKSADLLTMGLRLFRRSTK